MATSHIVRGYGPLDLFLAKQRYKTAERQIESIRKRGRILDIGCGSYPLFLTTVAFEEKYGLERGVDEDARKKMKELGITVINHSAEDEKGLPFGDNYFDVVSALAVFEHIEPRHLAGIHKEIYRVLKPGGIYVMTTPAVWTDGLLRMLAKLRLITDVEIKDHKGSYNHSMISSVLGEAGFCKEKMRFGYFELFMNNWVTATK